MRKIIVDFDNTFTIEGRDIDDLIAFLYLYEKEDIEIPFVTTTFGNSNQDEIYNSTLQCFKDLGIDIPVYRGASQNDNCKIAAENIRDYIKDNPGEVEILALGALRNFKILVDIDPGIENSVKSFTAMGGISSPLFFGGKKMDELNFSIDCKSAYKVINKFKIPNIITGNNCIDNVCSYDIISKLKFSKYPILKSPIKRWLDFFSDKYEFSGVVLWDLIAALYLYRPDLFEDHIDRYDISEENLKGGYLKADSSGKKLNLPSPKKGIDYLKALDFL
ncbi:MAG: nucleoside hydrolase [Tissierellia bacterium]|nr:nucleoside hydrolase [Tissierellia bacterium]